jgi:outer membrane receptor protein involved in Fe transport
VGTTYSWNYGAEFAPVPDIRARAVWARATRAPNINELFGGRSQTFPTGLQDPCVGVTATSTGATAVNCRASPGVLQNIATNGSFTLNQSDLQGVSGFGSGNPNLEEERGDTFTAGVVINPTSIRAIRNFVFTADYFNIRIRNAVAARGRQDILNECFQENDPVSCALITRRANPEGPNSAGSLQFIDTFPQNAAAINTEGLDFTLSYRQRLSDWGLGSGTVSAKVSYTHLMKLDFFATADSPKNPSAGEIGAAKDKATGSISYDDRTFGATLRGTFIGRSYLDDQFFNSSTFLNLTGDNVLEAGDKGTRPFSVGSYFTLDAQLRFSPAERFEFYAGVDNALNTDAPPIISGLSGNSTGTQTEAGTYDPIGRRFYAGARLKF